MGEKYVAYYRVSTQKQGRSGLGLEAQGAAVRASYGAVLAEYVEVESGRNNRRPELAKALAHCRAAQATLVIAKLDRLGRSRSFLMQIMDSGADILCADMPDANRLTLGMMAVLADYESQMISERTKAAIAAKKVRGGSWSHAMPPRGTAETARKAREALAQKRAEKRASLKPAVEEIRARGISSKRGIASELNRLGYVGMHGGLFSASSVGSLL